MSDPLWCYDINNVICPTDTLRQYSDLHVTYHKVSRYTSAYMHEDVDTTVYTAKY